MADLSKYRELENKYAEYLLKATKHLEYSLNKSHVLPKELDKNTEESLEGWEGLTARFARVVDIFLTKYIKAKVKSDDPIFDGTLRDYLNMAEKAKLIENVDHWLSLRELRNIQAHDYTNEAFQQFITAIQLESQFVLSEMKKLGLYAP